jgi:GNAT superfamily N-acetyltransferase
MNIDYQVVTSTEFVRTVQQRLGYCPDRGDDLKSVANLAGLEYLNHAYNDMENSHHSISDDHYGIVAIDRSSSMLLGFISLCRFDLHDIRKGDVICEISVRASHRGQGISYGLLNAAAQACITQHEDSGEDGLPLMTLSGLSDHGSFSGRMRLVSPLERLFDAHPSLMMNLSYGDRHDPALAPLNTKFQSRLNPVLAIHL